MTTLPDGDGSVISSASDGVVTVRRLVAIAVSAVDVLHPDSDLRHVAGAATEVDVLVARTDRPVPARTVLPQDAPDYLERADGPGAAVVDDVLAGLTVPLPERDGWHRDAPALPPGVRLHRLDLRWRVQDADEPDLVAALSELIGFDPDDQVFCVAPVAGPGEPPDPEITTVGRAVGRVARVYGLPVLHYRRISGHTGPVLPPPARPEAVL